MRPPLSSTGFGRVNGTLTGDHLETAAVQMRGSRHGGDPGGSPVPRTPQMALGDSSASGRNPAAALSAIRSA